MNEKSGFSKELDPSVLRMSSTEDETCEALQTDLGIEVEPENTAEFVGETWPAIKNGRYFYTPFFVNDASFQFESFDESWKISMEGNKIFVTKTRK